MEENKNSQGSETLSDSLSFEEDFFKEMKFEEKKSKNNNEKKDFQENSEQNILSGNEEFSDFENEDSIDDILNMIDTFNNEENDSSSIVNQNNDTTEDESLDLDDAMDLDDLMNSFNMMDRVENEDSNELEVDELMNNIDMLENDNLMNSLDIMGIDELSSTQEYMNSDNYESTDDISDIFSDVLGVVSSVEEINQEKELLKSIQEMHGKTEEKAESTNKKTYKNIFNKKEKLKTKLSNENNIEKETIFKKLFANIVDEKSEKAELKDKETLEINEALKIEKERIKEEQNVIKGEKKEEAKKISEEKKKIKLSQKQTKAEAKTEAKVKAKEDKDNRLKAEALEDKGRINKLGAGLVFAFLAVATIVTIVGSNRMFYSASIVNAKYYFEGQNYSKAYKEVEGLTIKNNDVELYDKIKTVMYVNKQLNSYNNYTTMRYYPEALDSLLKGLVRYDKYIEKANELGIKSDLDYVRAQILAELKKNFSLTEKEATKIINSKDKTKYSDTILSIVSKTK